MLAHYFCFQKSPSKRQDFNDLHSIVLYLTRADHPQGVFYVVEVPNLKIKYDLHEGSVHSARIVSRNDKIKTFYAAKFLRLYMQPIRDAINSVAKLNLLLQIAKLEDKELEKYIHSNHYNEQKEFINLGLQNLDATLNCIKNKGRQPIILALFKKSQKLSDIHDAVCQALRHHGINSIRCKKDVELIMTKIKSILAAKKEQRNQSATMR